MAFLFLDHLTKIYPLRHSLPKGEHRQGHCVFSDLCLTIEEGEFVSLIGHSGCGKSTLINLIAGFDRPTAGRILLEDKEVKRPGLDRMVVFQNFALMPWLSAYENIAMAVRCAYPHWEEERVRAWTEKYLHLTNLSEASQKRPPHLSGGMQQRVGIARAFAVNPKVLLLDEPFAQIDPFTRNEIQAELEWMYYADHKTVFMVSHDVDCAILLSDRILIMSNGPDAKIIDEIHVTLPRPRLGETTLPYAETMELRKRILAGLTQGASSLQ